MFGCRQFCDNYCYFSKSTCPTLLPDEECYRSWNYFQPWVLSSRLAGLHVSFFVSRFSYSAKDSHLVSNIFLCCVYSSIFLIPHIPFLLIFKCRHFFYCISYLYSYKLSSQLIPVHSFSTWRHFLFLFPSFSLYTLLVRSVSLTPLKAQPFSDKVAWNPLPISLHSISTSPWLSFNVHF